MLPLPKIETSVTVAQDNRKPPPIGRTFGTTLTRDQIEALSDDPADLQQQLQDMAGPGAVIRIDSFEGGALPAKAQIRSIRISRDQFAAEYHAAGGVGHRHHHAAGPRPDPLLLRRSRPRRSAERPQPVHADSRTRAESSITGSASSGR